MMLDLDNFKQFNDSHGHLMGDELLRALGVYLKTHVRPEGIPARYGGEEFTLILPGATCEMVRARAENLRQGFKDLKFDRGNGTDKVTGRTSLSVGVAVFPAHGSSVEAVLQAADEALYQAKLAGKDCVVVASDPQPALPHSEDDVVHNAIDGHLA